MSTEHRPLLLPCFFPSTYSTTMKTKQKWNPSSLNLNTKFHHLIDNFTWDTRMKKIINHTIYRLQYSFSCAKITYLVPCHCNFLPQGPHCSKASWLHKWYLITQAVFMWKNWQKRTDIDGATSLQVWCGNDEFWRCHLLGPSIIMMFIIALSWCMILWQNFFHDTCGSNSGCGMENRTSRKPERNLEQPWSNPGATLMKPQRNIP